MDRSNVLTLIGASYAVDELGQRVPVEVPRKVFCDLRSVTRAEWAAAGQLGLKPDLVATMFSPDYQGEQIAELTTPLVSSESSYLLDADGKQLRDSAGQLLREQGGDARGSTIRYGVYRTYLGRNETIELYLERKTGVSNG